MNTPATATSLTVSQALRRVKKCKGRMAELTQRAAGVVSYEAGKKPDFDFKVLRGEVASVREELVTLEAAVAKANALATVSFEGRHVTVAEAIRRLQELKAEMAWVSNLHLRSGTERQGEAEWDEELGRSVRRSREVTYVSELSEPGRVAELDALRDRFERLNDAVERQNHTTLVDWQEPSAPRAAA